MTWAEGDWRNCTSHLTSWRRSWTTSIGWQQDVPGGMTLPDLSLKFILRIRRVDDLPACAGRGMSTKPGRQTAAPDGGGPRSASVTGGCGLTTSLNRRDDAAHAPFGRWICFILEVANRTEEHAVEAWDSSEVSRGRVAAVRNKFKTRSTKPDLQPRNLQCLPSALSRRAHGHAFGSRHLLPFRPFEVERR